MATPATSRLVARSFPAAHRNRTEKIGWVATRTALAKAEVRSSPRTKLI